MTASEAIERIDEVLESEYRFDETLGYQLTSDDFEWLEKAKQALEKQIPKKPLVKIHRYIGSDDDFTSQYYCPVCNILITNEDTNGFYAGRKQKHCDCGQALDWSDIE